MAHPAQRFRPSQTQCLSSALAIFCCFLACYTAAAETAALDGRAIVVDGDTLEIAGSRVRLEGIDAPELAQTCSRGSGEAWDCGQEARLVLAAIVAGKDVACDQKGLDKYRRILGVCFVDGEDINAIMVTTGYARAFVKYSTTYEPLEAEARVAGAGIWQGESVAPWDYRRGRWQEAEDSAPNGCAIKGNISRNGHIYHLPWMTWYDRVKVDEARGERWFCSEDEAMAAGWRPAKPQS